MSGRDELTTDQVSRRIADAMHLVHDLYIEMIGFFRVLSESLEASDLDLAQIKMGGFRLPRTVKQLRTKADRYMALDLGLALEIGVKADEEEEEEDLDEYEEDAKLSKKQMFITPDSRFLVFRAVLLDPVLAEKGAFTPVVVGATLGDFVKRGKAKKHVEPENSFKFKRMRLLKLVRQIDGGTTAEQSLVIREAKTEVAAKVTSIVVRPLAEFVDEDRVRTFVDEVLATADGTA